MELFVHIHTNNLSPCPDTNIRTQVLWSLKSSPGETTLQKQWKKARWEEKAVVALLVI